VNPHVFSYMGFYDVTSSFCHALHRGGRSVPAVRCTGAAADLCLGKAVQVDPVKHTSKAPGSKLLKLKYDGPLSNFAFNFNLRRYTSGLSVTITINAGGATKSRNCGSPNTVGRSRLTLSNPR